MALILASKSASRQAMLNAAHVEFESRPADIDEDLLKIEHAHLDPPALALELAVAKAKAVSAYAPGQLVLGSDSIVSLGARMFSKPVSREDAASHLRTFSGKTLRLDSAAALVRDDQLLAPMNDHALLEVRALSDAQIESYLDLEWPAISGCVGCFRIEARGVHLFDRIMGDHFTILGMPLVPVLHALRGLGENRL